MRVGLLGVCAVGLLLFGAMGANAAVTPTGWTEIPELSELTGVKVFTAHPWEWQATALAVPDGNVFYPDPYILIRPRKAKAVLKSYHPRRPVTIWQALGWSALANEYAHITHQDATDIGGWDGGLRHWPTIRRLMGELMTNAGISPSKRREIIRLARRTV